MRGSNADRYTAPKPTRAKVADYLTVYNAHFPRRADGDWAEHMIRSGIPIGLLPDLARLTAHAAARWNNEQWADLEARALLLDIAGRYCSGTTLTREQTLGWLTVVASAPDYDTAHDLASRFAGLGSSRPGAWWMPWAQVPGQRGPLVQAAGLWELAEAEGVSDKVLLMMAALRGWSFPPGSVGARVA